MDPMGKEGRQMFIPLSLVDYHPFLSIDRVVTSNTYLSEGHILIEYVQTKSIVRNEGRGP